MKNNRYKSKWIFHRLDQRDPVDLLLKDHEVKVWLKRRVLIKKLINNSRLIILHHSLCCIIHTRPKKKTSSKNFLVLTIPWWASYANFRIFFRNDCGTTILFPPRTIPLKLDNSSLIALYGLRSPVSDHFPHWICNEVIRTAWCYCWFRSASQRGWQPEVLTCENKSYVRKIFFRLVTSVGQRNNSESPWGIEPQTFGFRAPML